MKTKLLFFLMSAIMLVGCEQEVELAEPLTKADVSEVVSEIGTRSLAGAVYNEVVDAWMVPQKDPYTLENFQKAYDDLKAGRSAQTLTKAQAAGFSVAKKLKPTHYALKIYPKNEEEQWKVETMEDVQVSYIPFDHVQLTEDEAAKMARTKSAANTFAEKSPYTVTYDYNEVTDGGPTGPQAFQLPILHTVWPVDKPLPEDLEYVVDYEVFLPRAAAQSIGVVDVLESEAVSSALGYQVSIPAPAAVTRAFLSPVISGNLRTYDNTLNAEVPLANLKVKAQLGSNIYDSYTNSAGYFNINVSSSFPIMSTTLTLVYQDPAGRWKITPTDNATPLAVTISARVSGMSVPVTVLPAGDRQVNEIHRAVNYFFNNQTTFPRHIYPSGGVRIIAHSKSGGNIAGSFNGNIQYDPNGSINIDKTIASTLIEIYNNGNPNSVVIGTTLHEIGHATHLYNNPYHYDNSHKFLRESFASYVGWYLGEEYYKSLGWVKPGGNSDITWNGRQGWTKNTNSTFGILWGSANRGWYSPLFIDLTDSYNQRTAFSFYPNDAIGGVPASMIWNILTYGTSWAQCRSKLQSYVGTYYTASEFNNWVADFDYWFANE